MDRRGPMRDGRATGEGPTTSPARPATPDLVRFESADGVVAWLPASVNEATGELAVFELPDGASAHVPYAMLYMPVEGTPRVLGDKKTITRVAEWIATKHPDLAAILLDVIHQRWEAVIDDAGV
jgi:hypothetical protein